MGFTDYVLNFVLLIKIILWAIWMKRKNKRVILDDTFHLFKFKILFKLIIRIFSLIFEIYFDLTSFVDNT